MAIFQMGDFQFPTKKEAQEIAKQILNEAELNVPLEGDEFHFVRELAGRHPEIGDRKNQIEAIWVSDGHHGKFRKSRAFYYVMEDGNGEQDHFSIYVAFDGKAQNIYSRNNEASRNEVHDQVIRYRDEHFAGYDRAPSELGGEMMSKDECQVDHVTPFNELFKAWCKDYDIDIFHDDLAVKATMPQFKNRYQARKWSNYHQENAKLRCITKTEHQEITNQYATQRSKVNQCT